MNGERQSIQTVPFDTPSPHPDACLPTPNHPHILLLFLLPSEGPLRLSVCLQSMGGWVGGWMSRPHVFSSSSFFSQQSGRCRCLCVYDLWVGGWVGWVYYLLENALVLGLLSPLLGGGSACCCGRRRRWRRRGGGGGRRGVFREGGGWGHGAPQASVDGEGGGGGGGGGGGDIKAEAPPDVVADHTGAAAAVLALLHSSSSSSFTTCSLHGHVQGRAASRTYPHPSFPPPSPSPHQRPHCAWMQARAAPTRCSDVVLRPPWLCV